MPGPTDSLQEAHEDELAERVSSLLAKERIKNILRALSGGPLQPSEIERQLAIARSTLYGCLHELLAVGLLRQDQRASFPRTVEYTITATGRVVSARAILTHRRHTRELMPYGSERGEELLDVLRLLVPASAVSEGLTGVCVLRKRLPSGQTLEMVVLAEGGHLRLYEDGLPLPWPVSATIEAPTAAWDDALLTGRLEEIEIKGDRALADAVLHALGDALC